MASREMIERALDAFCTNDDGSRLVLDKPTSISFQSQLRRMSAALDAAYTPGEDVGGVAERLREAAVEIRNDGTPSQVGLDEDECLSTADLIEAQAAQIASLSPKVAEVEGERDAAIDTIRAIKTRYETGDKFRAEHAEARASELERGVERLRQALVGMIVVGEAYLPADAPNGPCDKRIAAARAALQQEGESDE